MQNRERIVLKGRTNKYIEQIGFVVITTYIYIYIYIYTYTYIIYGGKCPGCKCTGGLCPWGKCSMGTCPGRFCPVTYMVI